MIVCALLLNFILLHIFFRNGTASQIYEISLDMSYDDNPMFMWTVSHPYVTDAIFILLAGFISGIAGALGAAVALFVKERKAAYIITLVLWEILGMQRLSLFLIFQPYSEYVWQEYLQIFLCYIILFAGSAGLLLRHEIRRKEYIL